MPKQELKILFCEDVGCPLAEYEERAFRQCLPWLARCLAPSIRRLAPDFFSEDFKFIRYLGAATGGREVQSEVLSFQDANRAKRSWLRTGLRIRASGRKAAALAERLFAQAHRPSNPT